MSYLPLAAGELYGIIGKLKRSHARHNDAIDAMTNDLEDSINLVLQARATVSEPTPSAHIHQSPRTTGATSKLAQIHLSPTHGHSNSAMDFSPAPSPMKWRPEENKSVTKARYTVNLWRRSGRHIQIETTKKIYAKIISGTSLPQPLAYAKQVSILAATKSDAEDAVKQLSPKTNFIEVFIMAKYPGNDKCALDSRNTVPVYYVNEDLQKAAASISRTLNGLPPADRQRNFVSKYGDASRLSPNPDRISASPPRREARKRTEEHVVPPKKPRFQPNVESHENLIIKPVPTSVPRQAAKSLSVMLDAANTIVQKNNPTLKTPTVASNSDTVEVLSPDNVPTPQLGDNNELSGLESTGREANETMDHGEPIDDQSQSEPNLQKNVDELDYDGNNPLAIDETAKEDDPFTF